MRYGQQIDFKNQVEIVTLHQKNDRIDATKEELN